VAEARRVLDHRGHDVAFVDYALIAEGGLRLVEWALKSGKLKTAYGLAGHPAQLEQTRAGFEAIVAKPIDLGEVRALLEARTAAPALLTQAQRDRLAVDHLGWATSIARKIARRVPQWIGRDDLEGAAMMGLVEATRRFQPSRGQTFAAFAERRIRGAVLDELRRGDIMSRQARQSARKVKEAVRELEQQLGRAPAREEVAASLDMTVERFGDELEQLTTVGFVELEAVDAAGASVHSTTFDCPARNAEASQTRASLHAGLAELPARDAQILSLYYADDLGYAEIGKRLGVSESRVCQLHGRAIGRLRERLGDELA
jgi:RNA polymerase sigma factor for flagellar operon FliA